MTRTRDLAEKLLALAKAKQESDPYDWTKADADFQDAVNVSDVSRLCTRLIKLEDALKFYADKRNWVIRIHKTEAGGVTQRMGDRDKRARKALKEDENG